MSNRTVYMVLGLLIQSHIQQAHFRLDRMIERLSCLCFILSLFAHAAIRVLFNVRIPRQQPLAVQETLLASVRKFASQTARLQNAELPQNAQQFPALLSAILQLMLLQTIMSIVDGIHYVDALPNVRAATQRLQAHPLVLLIVRSLPGAHPPLAARHCLHHFHHFQHFQHNLRHQQHLRHLLH
mmetsp:Transcript_8634/g.20731  ORF Transcript_8634/g.20731 Transcript_8634/m.20731 type:complete len:183 (-) Transcript_8634:8-556(-)